MKNLDIVYFGNGKRGVICLKHLLENGKKIVLVVVHPEDFDPHPTKWNETVKHTAESKGIPVFAPKNINSPESISKLLEYQPDLMVIGGYGQILTQRVIDIPREGTLNLHGGLLPRYRGSSPINWAIINGEKTGGCTVIFIDDGIDTGDIVTQEKFDIGIDDTALDIQKKTFRIFPRLLLSSINDIENNTVNRLKQDESKAFYYHRRTPADGIIDWSSMSALQVHNKVRALTHPYPGAFTHHEGRKLLIWRTSLLHEDIRGIPGRVAFRRENGVVVIAKDRGLLVETVEEIGKGERPSRDYFKKSGVNLGL